MVGVLLFPFADYRGPFSILRSSHVSLRESTDENVGGMVGPPYGCKSVVKRSVSLEDSSSS